MNHLPNGQFFSTNTEYTHLIKSKTKLGFCVTNEYDISRLEKKVSNWIAFFLVIKSMGGLVFFTSQFSYGLAGYVLGILSQFTGMYLNLYGILCLTKLMSQIEEENNNTYRVSAYHELSFYCCSEKYRTFWKVLIMLLFTFVNATTAVGYVISASNFVHIDVWSIDTRIIKVIIMVIGLIILFLTVQPENYKYIAVWLFIVLIASWAIAVVKILDYTITDYNHNATRSLFRWDNLLQSLSMSIYGYSGNLLFTIKNTMKYPSKLDNLYTKAIFVLLFMFIFSGFLCYTAFGNEFLKVSMLLYFSGDKLLQVLNFFANCTFVLWFPFKIISVLEQLEYFEFFKNWLNKGENESTTELSPEGWKWGSLSKILFTRLVGGIIICLLSFITDSIETVIRFGGCQFIPVTFFLTPVALKYMRNHHYESHGFSWWVILHDVIYVLAVIVYIVTSTLNFFDIF